MKRSTILPALGTALAASFALTAAPAQATVASATIEGNVATLNLDAANDVVTVSVSNGLLVHGQTSGGLHSGSDWNSAMEGDQTVAANGTFFVEINGGDGNDALTVLAKNTEIVSAHLDGQGGDDALTGADSNDALTGGDGNDRLIGAQGADQVNGGNGNDTMVWNNGDASDGFNGEAGTDTVEVNGSPNLGDAFTLDPDVTAGVIDFQRLNLKQFTLLTQAERFQINGLGGNDAVATSDGVGARTLLSVDGGAGDDKVDGSDGADLLLGGEGSDVLNGGAGDDRIAGDRGDDTLNGGEGDDTLVWNNGDNTDVLNGDDGRDDVEVNGAPTAGDAFTVQPNGGRIKFDRANLVPFSLDIGSSETLHANGLGGDDSIAVGDVGSYAVTGSGGPGNDTLTGGNSSETFLGGSGSDTITPGGGLDVVSGDEGDDQVNIRDNTADVARGGDGNDSVVADTADLDILDGFETIDRTQVAPPPPPPDTTTRPVTIAGGTVKVNRSRRTASIKVSCPADSPGNCVGSLSLRTAKSVRLGGVNVVLRLGSARYDITAGSPATVTIKLPRGVERLTDRKGHLPVLAIASTGASGKIASSSKHLTLAIAGASRKGR